MVTIHSSQWLGLKERIPTAIPSLILNLILFISLHIESFCCAQYYSTEPFGLL